MAQVNNKRVLKNTVYLYLRMFLGLVVSLVTAKVILDALGTVDYGLNNVVGGLITLFSFFNGSLSTSTSRFISYELGKGDNSKLSIIYSNAFIIHIVLAIIIVLLGETIGVYLVNHVMNIPDCRLFACSVLWQLVLIGAFLTVIAVPMNAIIIAFEKMNVYAYIGMFDIISRLFIVYLVKYSPYDKLISLAVLNAFISVVNFIFYYLYIRMKFSTLVSYCMKYDMLIIRRMLGFTLWGVIGSTAVMLRTTGINFLLNLFFGPIANAANAIAYRVNSAIIGFTSNFTTAVNPQIIKSYAAEEYEDMKSLIMRSGKLTYYMLMLLCFPVIFECDFILHIWLGDNLPDDAIIMTQLVLIISMIDTFTYSIGCAVQATGNIRNYQLAVSGINILIFPISWLCFKMGMPAYAGLIVFMFCSLINLIVRLPFLKTLLHIMPSEYITKVFMRTGIVTIISIIPPLILSYYMLDSGVRCFIMVVTTTMASTITILLFGLDEREKFFIKSTISKIFKRII